jgi:hypothetical protein
MKGIQSLYRHKGVADFKSFKANYGRPATKIRTGVDMKAILINKRSFFLFVF